MYSLCFVLHPVSNMYCLGSQERLNPILSWHWASGRVHPHQVAIVPLGQHRKTTHIHNSYGCAVMVQWCIKTPACYMQWTGISSVGVCAVVKRVNKYSCEASSSSAKHYCRSPILHEEWSLQSVNTQWEAMEEESRKSRTWPFLVQCFTCLLF